MPDLKKMLTLEALSEALPSWLKRSTKPEYNADEIDSTLTTNQFVTASDKDNWNAKGTYSKPSGGIPKSDLSSIVQTSLEKADSALQSETDPTVPSWAKQTNKPSYTQDEVADGSTYKRVTQNEKDAWSGKQNALTTTQMNAVNSGITSAGVAQIGTNQTNVLYAIDTGVKNVLENKNPNKKVTVQGITFTVNDDGTITANGTATANTDYRFETGYIPNIYKGYIYSGINTGSSTTYRLLVAYSNDGSTFVTENYVYTEPIIISSNYSYVSFKIFVTSGASLNNVVFSPMLSHPDIYNLDPSYVPYALPNSELTRLESEDRAALAEEIDAGAKNVWDFANAAFGQSSHESHTKTNTSITVTSTGDWGYVSYGLPLKVGSYILSFKISNYTAASGTNPYIRVAVSKNGDYARAGSDIGDNGTYTIKFTAETEGTYWVIFGSNWSGTSGVAGYTASDLMVCTKAAFDVSQKFVPYRPDWDAIDLKTKYLAQINTSNATSWAFPVNSDRNHFRYGLLFGGGSSQAPTNASVYLVFDDASNITITKIFGNSGVTFTGAVSNSILTITSSSTIYGGVRLLWLN